MTLTLTLAITLSGLDNGPGSQRADPSNSMLTPLLVDPLFIQDIDF